jgi:hypothetical protein
MPCEIFMLGVVSCRYTRNFLSGALYEGKKQAFWGRGWRVVGAKVNQHSQTGGGTFFTFLRAWVPPIWPCKSIFRSHSRLVICFCAEMLSQNHFVEPNQNGFV